MDKAFYQISEEQIMVIRKAVLQFQNLIVYTRKEFGIPEQGFISTDKESLKNDLFNGGLLFKYILTGDEAKEEYKELLLEIDSKLEIVIDSILKSTTFNKLLLQKLLFAYLFYNEFFIFEIKKLNKETKKVEIKKVVFNPDSNISMEEFKEFVLKENQKSYSEKEIEAYYNLATRFANGFFHLRKR